MAEAYQVPSGLEGSARPSGQTTYAVRCEASHADRNADRGNSRRTRLNRTPGSFTVTVVSERPQTTTRWPSPDSGRVFPFHTA